MIFKAIKKAVKKIGRGLKKVVKKIGRGIKKVVGKIGKFMGKIGFVGQLALGLLLPGVGAFLGKTAGFLMGASNPIIAGAGKFLNAAINVGTKTGKVFSSITSGITNVVGEVVGAAANKLGLAEPFKAVTSSLGINKGAGIDISNKNFSSVFSEVQKAGTNFANAGKDLFSMDTLTATNKFTLDQKMSKLSKMTDPKNMNIDVDLDPSGDAAITDFRDDAIKSNTNTRSLSDSLKDTNVNDVATKNAENVVDSLLGNTNKDVVVEKSIGELAADAYDSLKKNVVEGVQKIPSKLGEKIADAPGQYIEARVLGEAQVAAGAFPTVEENTYVNNPPNIVSQSADIGIGGYETGFNANMYTNNVDFISRYPVGQSAGTYNAYQNYLQGAT